jgi:hypothetical protein
MADDHPERLDPVPERVHPVVALFGWVTFSVELHRQGQAIRGVDRYGIADGAGYGIMCIG